MPSSPRPHLIVIPAFNGCLVNCVRVVLAASDKQIGDASQTHLNEELSPSTVGCHPNVVSRRVVSMKHESKDMRMDDLIAKGFERHGFRFWRVEVVEILRTVIVHDGWGLALQKVRRHADLLPPVGVGELVRLA